VIGILKQAFPNEEGVAHNIELAANVLTSMAEAMGSLSTSADSMAGLAELTEGWLFGTFGNSIADDIKEAIPGLTSLVFSMALFTKTVIGILKRAFPNKEGVAHNIELAANVLTSMAEAMTKISEVAGVLSEELIPLIEKSWWGWGSSPAEDILKSTDDFAAFFENLSTFFKKGIIAPIDGLFADNGKETIESIVNLAKLISVLPDFLGGVSQRMEKIMAAASKLDNFVGMKEKFGEKFRGVSEFIKEGILDPIDGLPAVGEINKSLQKVNILSNVLGKLVGVMEQLGKIMSIMARTKFEPTEAIEEINNLMASLGGLGVGGANLGEAKTGTVSAGPISDAHDRVRAKHTLEKEQGGKGGGDMAQISASTLDQVSLLGILHEDNLKIINLLTPSDLSGEVAGAASTATQNRNPATPSNYGNWRPSTASRNVTKGT
jgi:hypothetical protein